MYSMMQSILTEDMEDPIDEDKVEGALYVLKTATTVGIDFWSPGDLRRLARAALGALGQILVQVEDQATWPSFLLYNIIVLVGKPLGGTRPIALMPMLYKVWTRIRKPYIQKWERAIAGPWDAAVAGSSALRAALTSMFGNELAYYKGEATSSTLYDTERFYDNISIPVLIREATRL
eukprot:12425469-Karenia_brevis.AAC.1